MRQPLFELIPGMAIWIGIASIAIPSLGQNSDFNLNAHANSHATPQEIGLPLYPGATPINDKDGDSSSANLSFLLNSFHISVKAASFETADSAERVLGFYRKPLAKFGEVLECNHGKPVGSLTVTKSGLTCGDHEGGRMTVNGSDSGHELRSGRPEQFWIVGIDGAEKSKTKFGLVALALPKDQDSK